MAKSALRSSTALRDPQSATNVAALRALSLGYSPSTATTVWFCGSTSSTLSPTVV